MARKEEALSWAFPAFLATQRELLISTQLDCPGISPTASRLSQSQMIFKIISPNSVQALHSPLSSQAPHSDQQSTLCAGAGFSRRERLIRGAGLFRLWSSLVLCAFLNSPHEQSSCCLHEACLWKTHKEVHICPFTQCPQHRAKACPQLRLLAPQTAVTHTCNPSTKAKEFEASLG